MLKEEGNTHKEGEEINNEQEEDDEISLERYNKGVWNIEELKNFKEEWIKEQTKLKIELKTSDTNLTFNLTTDDDLRNNLNNNYTTLNYIGGVDISFDKEDPKKAVASVVVLNFPELKIIYQKFENVIMNYPYIPGFLAFREVPHLKVMIEELREKHADIFPQIILVDGNGVLHQRGFGLASHLGVVLDIPTIGVAKKLYFLDGITRETVKELTKQHLRKGGDYANLVGESGTIHGALLQPTDNCKRPLYISIGHRVCLSTAIEVVKRCCKFKIPEPIRAADLGRRKEEE
ncbi:hypothetical protein ABK040_008409 [Willaertia magna]